LFYLKNVKEERKKEKKKKKKKKKRIRAIIPTNTVSLTFFFFAGAHD